MKILIKVFLLYPAPLVARGYIKFVQMHAIPKTHLLLYRSIQKAIVI